MRATLIAALLSVCASAIPAQPPVDECRRAAPDWVWCDDFERDRLSQYFEVQRGDGRLARESGAGIGGSVGLRSTFPAGVVDAGALHLAIGRTPQAYMRAVGPTVDHRDIYWRFFVRREPGWTGGGGEKLTRAMILSNPRGFAQAMIAHVWSGRSGTPQAAYLELDPARGTDSSGTVITRRYNDSERLRWLSKQRSLRPVFAESTVGQWQCIEVRVLLNDPGASNGEFRLWVDDREEAARSALDWVGPYRALGINAIYLENYWNTGAPKEQSRSIDNFVVSTRRIGCGR